MPGSIEAARRQAGEQRIRSSGVAEELSHLNHSCVGAQLHVGCTSLMLPPVTATRTRKRSCESFKAHVTMQFCAVESTCTWRTSKVKFGEARLVAGELLPCAHAGQRTRRIRSLSMETAAKCRSFGRQVKQLECRATLAVELGKSEAHARTSAATREKTGFGMAALAWMKGAAPVPDHEHAMAPRWYFPWTDSLPRHPSG